MGRAECTDGFSQIGPPPIFTSKVLGLVFQSVQTRPDCFPLETQQVRVTRPPLDIQNAQFSFMGHRWVVQESGGDACVKEDGSELLGHLSPFLPVTSQDSCGRREAELVFCSNVCSHE